MIRHQHFAKLALARFTRMRARQADIGMSGARGSISPHVLSWDNGISQPYVDELQRRELCCAKELALGGDARNCVSASGEANDSVDETRRPVAIGANQSA